MPVDMMFVLATACFAWGLSLATYRWFAVHNEWPMGEWQAHRPGLPIAIGILTVTMAMLFALARGGPTILILPLFGVLLGWAWTALTKVGAQSALLLGPLAVVALISAWIVAAGPVETADARAGRTVIPAPMARDRLIDEPDRVITSPALKNGARNPQR